MLTSLDGKVAGDFLKVQRAEAFADIYEQIHDRYGVNAWMCGRVTMEEHFTFGHIPRTDYVANKNAESYAIAVDPSGKLGWTKNSIESWNEHRTQDHIIEVLTEQVSDAYLAHLKKFGISYIFGGKKRIDFTVVVQKLKNLFSINKLMLEGGGFLNGSFLNEGLIDELSLILVPIADGASNAVTLFETSSFLTNPHPVNFFLKEVEKLDDSGLWLRYVTEHD
jgi:riboflavin biosynthesis pyrimidine reductase